MPYFLKFHGIKLSSGQLHRVADSRLFLYATKVQLFSELCKYFGNFFTKNQRFFTKPSNTFLKASGKVLEGFVARNTSTWLVLHIEKIVRCVTDTKKILSKQIIGRKMTKSKEIIMLNLTKSKEIIQKAYII